MRGAACLYGCYAPDLNTASEQAYGGGPYLISGPEMAWYWNHYLSKRADRTNPLAAPLYADLRGLPPLFITACEFDPLRNNSEMLVEKLKAAGATYEFRLWLGTIHASVNLMGWIEAMGPRVDEVCAFLNQRDRKALNQSGTRALQAVPQQGSMITKARDLRTGRSVWEGRDAAKVRHARLRSDLKTDVLVVGAGITGAMIADALAEAGLAVIVVDRRDDPVKGSTVASTALVQYEIDTPLSILSRKIGKADAMRAWRRSRLAVDAVAARLADLRMTDVVRRDSLYLAGNELDADGLAREQAARRAIGLPDRLLSRKELKTRFGISRSAALLGYDNLVIDPRKAAHAMLASADRQRRAHLRTGPHRRYRMPCTRRDRAHRYRPHHPLSAISSWRPATRFQRTRRPAATRSFPLTRSRP